MRFKLTGTALRLSHTVLLGDELPDDEHGVTPVLKWIDFGLAVEIGR